MSSYKRMSFAAGALSAEDLNQLVANMDLLEDTMIKGYYFVNEISKNNGILVQGLVTGVVNHVSNTTRYANVYWPRPFSTGCKPVIVGGRYEERYNPVSVAVRAIDGSVHPGNTGFRAEVNLIEDRHWFGQANNWSDKATLYSFIGLGW